MEKLGAPINTNFWLNFLTHVLVKTYILKVNEGADNYLSSYKSQQM